MLDDNCIFCKIIKGDIPSNVIYEDDEFKVILDAGPVSRGHSLILPKSHYRDFYELPVDIAKDAIALAQKLMIDMTDKLGCDGFNIMQNNKEAADQSVPHYHMHLVPRYVDGQKLFSYKPMQFTPEEQKETAGLIKE